MKYVFYIISIIVLAGCKETHCPAFPNSLIEYYPYLINDVLRFVNSNNDTLTIEINNTWKTDGYSYAWNEKCACGADAGFDTNVNDNYSLKIEGNISATDITIFRCNFYNAKINNDNFAVRIEGNPYTEKLTDNFSDTILIEKQDYYRISHVKIIKGKGIVEFMDNELNCIWKKIE